MTASADAEPEESPLDYDRLYADYNAGLIDKLRGFGPATEYLSLWVPAEDPLAGLRNMLDAAASSGRKTLAVRLGEASVERAGGRDAILTMASCFGGASIESEAHGVLLQLSPLHPAQGTVSTRRSEHHMRTRGRTGDAAPELLSTARVLETQPDGIGSQYQDAVEAASGRADHLANPGSILPTDGALIVHATSQMAGARLELDVESGTHQILRARFGGAKTPVCHGILQGLCEVLEGLPVAEASDHALVRLEFRLRDCAGNRPVAGIVTPESADPAFHLPQALVRDAIARYRDETGFSDLENEHEDRPCERWMRADQKTRAAWVGAAIGEVIPVLGIARTSVSLVDIQLDVRIVLILDESIPVERKQQITMKLERALRDNVDARLEVYLEELKDRNKLRRLAVVE